MTRRQCKSIINLPTRKTRRSKLPPQTKNVQAAIMECILEEVEAEKILRLKHTSGARSERRICYGITNAVPESITTFTDSVTPELTTTIKENEKPSSNIPTEAKKRGRPKGTTKSEILAAKQKKQIAINYMLFRSIFS